MSYRPFVVSLFSRIKTVHGVARGRQNRLANRKINPPAIPRMMGVKCSIAIERQPGIRTFARPVIFQCGVVVQLRDFAVHVEQANQQTDEKNERQRHCDRPLVAPLMV